MESAGHAASVQTALQKAEFRAEDELIEISPSVRAGVIQLVCGNFGPFEPSVVTHVPLWLALAMKKLRRCRIIPPGWLSLSKLEETIKNEREDMDKLQKLPHYFSQIAALLLHHAEDDCESPGRLRRAVEDLSSIRAGKVRRWTRTNVRDRTVAVKVNDLTSLEIETNRPVLTRVLEGLYSTHVSGLDVDGVTSTFTTGSSTANTSSAPLQPQPRRILRRQGRQSDHLSLPR